MSNSNNFVGLGLSQYNLFAGPELDGEVPIEFSLSLDRLISEASEQRLVRNVCHVARINCAGHMQFIEHVGAQG